MTVGVGPVVVRNEEELEAASREITRETDPSQRGLIAALERSVPEPWATVQQIRDQFARAASALPAPKVTRVEAAPVGAGQSLLATPAGSTRKCLYLHGGAYLFGSPRTAVALAASVAEALSAQTLVLGYRLAPEATWPAPLLDAMEGLEWLRGADEETPIILAGDSAGGGLALCAAMEASRRGVGVAGVLAMSPWTDLRVGVAERVRPAGDPQAPAWLLERAANALLTDDASREHASPRIGVARPDASEVLPPTLVQVGSAESVYDDSLEFARAALHHGAPLRLEIWPRQLHVFQAFAPRMKVAQEALIHQRDWVQALPSPRS
jgi:monoterpene epsilon-lactone hydrolase